MASVSFQNIEKAFGSTKVIHGISFEIQDGEFMVLVGPSGCGKSTLLRMLAGLEEISGGTIAIDARPVNDIDSKDRDIAMVFQSYALYPHMTVRDNMGFSLRLRKADKSEIANRDAKLRVQMRSEIKALHQRLKTTTVYVTHDQIEAMTMADRIVVMHDGVIEQIGTPLELYDRPNNLFVAQCIGSPAMNIVQGTLRRTNGMAHVETPDGVRWPLRAGAGADGQAVTYGVRPDHLELAGNKDRG